MDTPPVTPHRRPPTPDVELGIAPPTPVSPLSSSTPYSKSPTQPARKKRSFSNVVVAEKMRKQPTPTRVLDINEIMNRVPNVTELSPHMWLTVFQAGHAETMKKIVALAKVLGHESLQAKCPLYLMLNRNLASLGEIAAWWQEISGYQKQMQEDFDTFRVLDCQYAEERRWFRFGPSVPVIPAGNDVEVLIAYLVGILNDLEMLHAQKVSEQVHADAANAVRDRIRAAADASRT
jgi:hypothetical protein